jgi:hypothetical protein
MEDKDAQKYSSLNDYTTIDVSKYSNYYTNVTVPHNKNFAYSTINSTIGSGALYSNNSGLKVTGPAEFEGDVKIKGKSIVDRLDAIEKRLSILTPNPKKLDKYEALQKAYAHYKTLEKLCFDDDDK